MRSSIEYDIVKKTFKSVLLAQLFSFMAQIIAMVVDSIVTGQCLGKDCLAAYGFASAVISIITAFAGFCMTGVSILCARSVGDTDEEARTSVFTSSVIFSIGLSTIITVLVLVFPGVWASMTGAKGEIATFTIEYIRGFGIGIVPAILVSSLYPVLQLDGDKKRMVVSFMVMAIVDIILDLFNGYVLHWGLFGMGLATSVSSLCALFVIIGHFFNKDHLFKFKWSTFKMSYVAEIFIFGYMYIIKQLLMTVLTLVYNNYLSNVYGSDMVVAYTAITSAGSLCLCFGMSIGSSASVLVGVYAGEEDGGALKRMMKVSIYYSVVLNLIVNVLACVFASPLISAYFNGKGEVFDVAVVGFRLYVLVMIIRSINLCIRGYYQSMKMQKLTFGFSVLHTFLGTLVAMFVLNAVMGINGIWLSFVVGESVALVILILFVKLTTKDQKFTFASILYLPEKYKTEYAEIFERSLGSMEQVTDYAKELQEFCIEKDEPKDKAYHMALAIEELAGNIVKYGFVDKKKHSIDIRVVKKADDWIIRLRDDCFNFNPLKYIDENDESVEHIGIRLIKDISKDFQYMNTLNMNVLVIKL